jgi:predicted transcriptional regulator
VEENLSYSKIGKILSVSRITVSHYLRKGGHQSNLKYYPNVPHEKYRKYTLNESVFDIIDTSEKAYWLGIFYADGDVSDARNVVELYLKELDYHHLVKMQKFFETNKPIKPKNKKFKGKIYKGFRLGISSKRIKGNLINFGCPPRKSKIIYFPDSIKVPVHLISHFIRGYFDGDGCITNANKGTTIAIEILGTEEFLRSIHHWTGFTLDRDPVKDFKHSDIKRLQYFGNDAKAFLDKIYENATIYLDRKYNLWNRIELMPAYRGPCWRLRAE